MRLKSAAPIRLIAFAALALLPAGTRAQSPDTVDVSGVVGNVETGEPIAGALVELPELGRKTVTGDGGRFVFMDLPPGPHRIRTEMLGYTAWEETTELEHLDLLRIGLLPRPIVLENIRVTVNRLERQRRAASVSVMAVEREDLVRSPYGDMATALRYGLRGNLPIHPVPCSAGGPQLLPATGGSNLEGSRRPPGDFGALLSVGDPMELCVMWRGRTIRPRIVIDNQPQDFLALSMYQPSELYAVEFYQGGRCIRVFTNYFIERGRPVLGAAAACLIAGR